ncbi:hypothetical protein D3C72_1847010 [compost metagenome]
MHIPRQVILVCTHDHRVLSRADVVTDQQLFVALFARAQPGGLDGNITVLVFFRADAQAGQMNHFFGQLDNPHRLAHVQDKDITALPHGARLNHQLCRFGNDHEVLSDLRMRDSQRTALLSACNVNSASRLVRPMTLVGRTALSVEIRTKLATPAFKAAWAVLSVPTTLFSSPSAMLCSTIGTCLYAAAW